MEEEKYKGSLEDFLKTDFSKIESQDITDFCETNSTILDILEVSPDFFIQDDVFDFKISSLEDLYTFLEDVVSKIPYSESRVGGFFTTQEFLKEGGVCTHFSSFLVMVLRRNGIKSKMVVGFATNKLVDGVKFYQSIPLDAEPAGHAWVEFEINGERWICEPNLWSYHLEEKTKGSEEYKKEILWLRNNTVYKKGSGKDKHLEIDVWTMMTKFGYTNLFLRKIRSCYKNYQAQRFIVLDSWEQER